MWVAPWGWTVWTSAVGKVGRSVRALAGTKDVWRADVRVAYLACSSVVPWVVSLVAVWAAKGRGAGRGAVEGAKKVSDIIWCTQSKEVVRRT